MPLLRDTQRPLRLHARNAVPQLACQRQAEPLADKDAPARDGEQHIALARREDLLIVSNLVLLPPRYLRILARDLRRIDAQERPRRISVLPLRGIEQRQRGGRLLLGGSRRL